MYLDENTFLSPIMKAEDTTSRRAMLKALSQSSGRFKASKLAKMGYPYAVRRLGGKIPYNDAGMINVQTGDFYFSWRLIPVTFRKGTISSGIKNESEHADALAKGTPTSIARPLLSRVEPIVNHVRIRNLSRAIRDAIQRSNN